MNQTVLLLRSILEQPHITQRTLAKEVGVSLGSVNKLIRSCLSDGLLRETAEEQEHRGAKSQGFSVTDAGLTFLQPYRVDSALILSAGFGSRFVPLTYETPKGLLEVLGEPMIERQIRQLHAVGVTDITIVVGYLKEKFEYLQDKFGVQLLYNPEYAVKNNLATVYHARNLLYGKNCYILSADNWLRENVYHTYEGGAWYCAAHADGDTAEWVLVTDRKGRIIETYPGGRDCNYMYGPAYFSRAFSAQFLPVLERYYEMPGTEQYYWETVLMEMLNGQADRRLTAYFGKKKTEAGANRKTSCRDIELYMNLQPDNVVYEFENLEELRRFDPKYVNDSGSEAMQLVSRVFGVPESEIRKIRCLKAGMTNNSWLFETGGKSYICRIPGKGTGKLINRREEKATYEAVEPLGITDRLVYFDEATGYKISRFYENSRNANPADEADMHCCMHLLRRLHTSGVRVAQVFDIGARIEDYERFCKEAAGEDGIPFRDYAKIRLQKDRLCDWLAAKKRPQVLCHIDSVADNFIFLPGADLPDAKKSNADAKKGGAASDGAKAACAGGRDESKLRLIDWEYAAMCDPIIDVAMCAIYSFMNEAQALRLLQFYLDKAGAEPGGQEKEKEKEKERKQENEKEKEQLDAPEKHKEKKDQLLEETKRLLFAYMALGGLLWSLWGVYKEACGVQQFSDYTLRMYRYFKQYAPKALPELAQI